MGEQVARRYIEKDPRPTSDLGGPALQGARATAAYSTSPEDALYMAYEGFPDIQKSLAEANHEQTAVDPAAIALSAVKETVQERSARTRYVVTSTPLNGDTRRKVETLTTEVL